MSSYCFYDGNNKLFLITFLRLQVIFLITKFFAPKKDGFDLS
jgi:hypothetical protein